MALSLRLDPAHDRGLVERRVERVAGDVRDRRRDAVRVAGRRAASPPNVRWSTKRSSGPSSAKRNRACRCFSSGAAAASTSSWPLMPRWTIRPSDRRRRSSQRYLPAPAHGVDAATGEAVGEVVRAGEVAAGHPVAAQLDVGDGAAERRGRPGRGGRPRPRAAQARPAVGPSGSSSSASPSGRGLLGADDRALVACRGWWSRPGRRPPARPPSWCARTPVPSTSPPTTTWAVNVFAWSGPSSMTRYSGTPRRVPGGELLQAGLPVQAGAEGGRLGHQRVEEAVHELAGGLDARRQVDRADDGLDGVGEDRGLVAAAGGLLAAAEADVVAEAEGAADVGQRAHVDDGGAQLGQLALAGVGVRVVERVGDDQAEHRVAEELQALVVRQPAVLVGVRAVGQGAPEQRCVDRAAGHLAGGGRAARDGSQRCQCTGRGRPLAHEGGISPGARCARRRRSGGPCRCRRTGTRRAAG